MINPYGIPQPDFGDVGSLAPNPMALNLNTPKIKKGGMFANADWGSAISAALNGFLAAGGNPAGVQGLSQLHQRKMLEQQQHLADQEYQQHRQDGLADYATKQQIDSQYPQYGEFERALMESGIHPGTPEWTQMMQRRRDNMLDPIVNTPMGPMMRSQVTGALAPQPAPPGVTFTPLPDEGDASGNAGGGFPY